ncbi:dTDP-4-dehydrorhamnose 3,5-epimerase [Defluviimonas sp. 20V17]|uniref:dTDP-4-dehydrorhamnose 3,5-epimerase n=1 Tax=Allgaiera indica TaxID=765699 RepID=A0AAN4UQL8_9RHOB|nr:dTDP-4-dehydrorhamnose 3,5-epimerase [Allgaiera indica]KDB03134.1 dTDP-4-dehydrorhamnose 3,5-epimerase [Defluviimonas sp. 20V17]GHE00946.1 dTDP-4-dehydrorhamnose 3,5-epimerase [Allgaiera indica]SDW74981.1 dTDP-4-dehydrorhamnose 3,5-epimerase [Allgaiera indica]
MIFAPLSLQGAWRVDPEPRGDARGLFARIFCAEEFGAHGLVARWVQMNVSLNREAGTLRGMHFQRPPAADAKLVRCTAGAILDVLVDLRAGSASFGAWCAVELTPDNRSAVYVPQGVAHGFQTLAPDSEVTYCHSAAYSPAHEGGLRYDDPAVGIDWPLPVANLSPRDQNNPLLAELEPITA